ncbi:MAG: NHL repeat-containing protein, partial [Chloroflexota bacterium]
MSPSYRKHFIVSSLLVILTLSILTIIGQNILYAANITVDTTNDVVDAGDCGTIDIRFLPGPDGVTSLREAICAANNTGGSDDITLPAGTYTLTLAGLGDDVGFSGDLDITDNLTINGAEATTTIIDANQLDRVFDHHNTQVTFNNLTITGGNTTAGEDGGGIRHEGPTLTLTSVIIHSNTAARDGGGVSYDTSGVDLNMTTSTVRNNNAGQNGGGIASLSGESTGTISRSAIYGNEATGNGGGVYIFNNTSISNSTISDNTASDGGGIATELFVDASLTNVTVTNNVNGGIYTNHGGGGTLTLRNTIVADQQNGTDCVVNAGTLTSDLHNLDSDNTCNLTNPNDHPNGNADLGPLQDNGGPTFTHAISATSDANNNGNSTVCADTPINNIDQRGETRPTATGCEIGAYELATGQITIVKEATPRNGIDFTFDTTFPGSGTYVTEAIWPDFEFADVVTLDSNDNVYVADRFRDRLYKYDSSGTLLAEWGQPGTGVSGFVFFADIAIDSAGNVYTLDRDAHRIQKFDSSGNFIEMWGWGVDDGTSTFQTCTSDCQTGLQGSNKGQFNGPQGMVFDSADNLHILDTGNNRVQTFDTNGNFITMWGFGVLDGTNAFQTCPAAAPSCQAGISGGAPGQFSDPWGIAIDSNDNLYTVDANEDLVQKFTSIGTFLTDWGNLGQLVFATSIAVDSNDIVYVGDQADDSVHLFDENGTFLRKIVTPGRKPLLEVQDVAVSSSGEVYVAADSHIFKLGLADLVLDDSLPDDRDDHSSSRTFTVPIGTYEVTEIIPVGWELTDLSCQSTGGGSNPVVTNATVTISVIEGQEVTCTYTNSGYHDLTIAKTTIPTTSTEDFDIEVSFALTGTIGAVGDLASDSSGNLYAFDGFTQQVIKYDNLLNPLLAFGGPGSGKAEFRGGRVDVDNNGIVYVADGFNQRIQKFQSDGTFIEMWGYGVLDGTNTFQICTAADASCQAGLSGNAAGQFNFPANVAFDSANNVYVGENGNRRIQKFQSNGTFIEAWGWGVDTGADAYEICTVATLPCQAGINSGNNNPEEFASIIDVVVDSTDTVHILDRISFTSFPLRSFAANGTFLNHTFIESSFRAMAGLSVDSQDQLYLVNDTFIEIRDSSGTLLERVPQDFILNRFINLEIDDQGTLFLSGEVVPDQTEGIVRVETITLGHGQSETLSDYPVAHYQIREPSKRDWRLTDVVCNGSPTQLVGAPQLRGADLHLTEDTSCIVENSQLSSVIIAKETTPAGGSDFAFSFDSSALSAQFVGEWSSTDTTVEQLGSTSYLTVDSSGNVYVSDFNRSRIVKFNSSGNVITTWGSPGTDADQFLGPQGMVVVGNRLYVADRFNVRISVFDLDGNFIETWGWGVDDGTNAFQICTVATLPCQTGLFGTEAGQFNQPIDIAADSNDNIYVIEEDNQRLQLFDSSGNFIEARGYGVDDGTNVYQICTSACQIGIFGEEAGQFARPFAIAIDSNDNVYISDSRDDRVQKFDSNGDFVFALGWGVDTNSDAFEICTAASAPCQAGHPGDGLGQFNSAEGLAVDANDNLYVADSGNQRIQTFDSNGNFLGTFGQPGADVGLIDDPEDLVIDADGNILMIDKGLHKVVEYSLLPTSFLLDDGGSDSFPYLEPGDYTIEETSLPAGWALNNIDCGNASAAVNGTSATVTVGFGEDITCTYSNRGAADLTISKTTNPTGSSEDFDILVSYAVTGTVDAPTIGAMATDSSGNLYAYNSSTNQVVKFDNLLNPLLAWGGPGNGAGEFHFASAIYIAVDGNDNIYVSDERNNRIQIFDSSGTFIEMWGYGVDDGSGVFQICTAATLPCQTGSSGANAGQFWRPNQVAFDSVGNVYATDFNNNRVQKLDSSGTFIEMWGYGVDDGSNVFQICTAATLPCQAGIA